MATAPPLPSLLNLSSPKQEQNFDNEDDIDAFIKQSKQPYQIWIESSVNNNNHHQQQLQLIVENKFTLSQDSLTSEKNTPSNYLQPKLRMNAR